MSLTLMMRGTWPMVAVAGAVLALAGCSSGTDGSAAPSAPGGGHSQAAAPAASADGYLTIPADTDAETRKEYVEQNALAACMRAKGFIFTPHVEQQNDTQINDVDGQDYAAAKKFREKYGFGIYAGAVYRDDPTVWGSAAYAKKNTSPDSGYLNALTPAQHKAYDDAMGMSVENGKRVTGPGCYLQAQEKAYGPAKTQAEIDQEDAQNRDRALAAQQALNGDPELVSLAQGYASCLTGQGITVTTTQPTSIGDMVKFSVSAQVPSGGVLSLSRQEALAKLTQEIGLAKKDLACGKDFRAAYFPKLAQHPFSDVTG